jgi:hypothetical protein
MLGRAGGGLRGQDLALMVGSRGDQGVRVKFHYTEHEHAARILSEQVFRVSDEPGSAGHGQYVTTVQPRSMPDEKLLDLLFARGRPVIAIEGVVVLWDDAFPWRRYPHRSYVHRSSPGRFWTCRSHWGIGMRREGNWLWSDGIYMPRT